MMNSVKPGTEEVIGILPDNSDPHLISFIKSLVDTYCEIPWAASEPCGYACSTRQPLHPSQSSVYHTSHDTVELDGTQWEHSLEFAMLGVAYVYSLSSYQDNSPLGGVIVLCLNTFAITVASMYFLGF